MVKVDSTNELRERCRELRREATDAEKILWKHLRRHALDGYYFRRQHPFRGFILDFYSAELKLAVEVDGAVHNDPDQAGYDEYRTYQLNAYGVEVIRFTNEAVLEDIDTVLQRICESAKRYKERQRDPIGV